ncbi:MAG: hypothetical protein A2087_03145 [Spirochaetes bacterium GWD1_61_31]|nr:MAG: hypothetical protein A2Y37_12670 [Spirochaetes bacterium GWB1_60_80]OHD32938.1 MAG: hypothetical protein A2004_01035 [Spirochaetes bacterium GWC1_61_12]OHD38676.1 MAG: hypothetical protein A2087_03145 [Spirochaetes bacterium GWD1_61_31]OHD43215.1 MAG: hypothetical protein A2Y35_08285 [Spirochaetes bacterium GWE1_60_18]OHD58777.1 MAG: hypothetical protein A2Y32_01125 [Spirochaetes bacterium GWF1_60_12]
MLPYGAGGIIKVTIRSSLSPKPRSSAVWLQSIATGSLAPGTVMTPSGDTKLKLRFQLPKRSEVTPLRVVAM